ncbi:peptidase dimerization domain-containing protein [Brachybacterium sp. EF45031]|uniref:peptidase dimerization domain-containing protein n=1 Tax=Brachybacterium sillae TaxID=2810536 RepID=UPI00217ECF7A|nr:peptidase dimerization domain-containing protein [Brachybacterium sillae]MCS6711820.1 peptidase dimerization domain-containing protein [Brachybacterium sillae]
MSTPSSSTNPTPTGHPGAPTGRAEGPTAPRRDRPDLEDALAERFLRYSAVVSQSDASATTVPTTEGQRELATLLAEELRALGAADVHVSETAVVTACIPSTLPEGASAPVIGLCSHLDTVDAGLSPVVHARIIEHTGGDIVLNAETGAAIREAEHPEIARYVGDRLLVADGTSVLGADDEAGLSVIMELAARLLAADAGGRATGAAATAGSDGTGQGAAAEPHGEIRIAFVPDEEIGLRGVRTLDMDRFPVDVAYTIDSGETGELVEETFNAATAELTIEGVTAHPMEAKGVLVNPILLARRFIARLDPEQTPECTEGREGY